MHYSLSISLFARGLCTSFPTRLLVCAQFFSENSRETGPPIVQILVGLRGGISQSETVWWWEPIYSTGKREPFQDDFCGVAVLVRRRGSFSAGADRLSQPKLHECTSVVKRTFQTGVYGNPNGKRIEGEDEKIRDACLKLRLGGK